MTRRTKKVGLAGRYGARYGVRIRKQIQTVEKAKGKSYECPRCRQVAVRRVASGIWKCRRCDLKFAGGAYNPHITARGHSSLKAEADKTVPEAVEVQGEEEA
jgi:large subunit ribosomal protein L37Ae